MNFSDFLKNDSSDAEKISFFEEHEKRGISAEEIAFAVDFFQKNPSSDSLDICGTGGSGLPRINASTLAAFVLASAGISIAKHGNRAASGRFGSFDLLEKLGVGIDLDFSASHSIFQKIGLGFFFAPKMYPEFARFAPARREFGRPTIFNLLGPLLSPLNPSRQVIGTSSIKNAHLLRDAARKLGKKFVAVVVGDGGLDEISLTGKSHIFDFEGEKTMTPADFGISAVSNFSEISSPNAEFNLAFARDFLAGKNLDSPHSHLVFMNCAFAFSFFSGDENFLENFRKSREIVVSGDAQKMFEQYRGLSWNFSEN